MQIAMLCFECQREARPPFFGPLVITYHDDLIAEAVCSRGHKNIFVLQDQKFEVLMESGVNALESGFTLEAVASFSAALERFHEFCMRVWYGDRQMGSDVWSPIFRHMINQSERQLGAFMMLYALRLGAVYIPDNKRAQFRNEVIHKGQIPTQEKAWAFCEAVYDEIYKLYKILEEQYRPALIAVIGGDTKARFDKLPKGSQASVTIGALFFSQGQIPSFREAYEKHLEGRQLGMKFTPSIGALQPGIAEPSTGK